MTSSVPSALTMTATVPGVTSATGISTLAEVPLGRSTVTVGAVSRSVVIGTSGMGRVTASPWASSTTAAGSFTSAWVLPVSSTVVAEEEPSLLVMVVSLVPSVFSTTWSCCPSCRW